EALNLNTSFPPLMDENKSQPLHVTGILLYRIQKQIEFLLLNDTFSHKKHWTAPKGVVIRQEDELKCALRNTIETTGLSVNDLRIEDDFKAEITYLSETRPKRVVYYLAQVSDHARVYTSGEGLNFAWLSLNVATEKAIFKSMQEIIKKAYTYIDKKKPKNPDPPLRSRIDKNQINSDRLDSRMKVLNLALPLDSQRQAMSRQRLELVRERQQHHRPEKNGNGFSSPLHSPVMPFENPLYKTRLCERFETEGYCPYGPKCTFAHGTVELRERPSGEEKIDAPPTAKDGPDNPLYKTRLCERFMKENFCQYGPKCNFAHGEEELRERPNIGHNNRDHENPEPHAQGNKPQHPHHRQNHANDDSEKKVYPSGPSITGGWRSERSEIQNGIFGRIAILSATDSINTTSSPQIEETQVDRTQDEAKFDSELEGRGVIEERKVLNEVERGETFNHKNEDNPKEQEEETKEHKENSFIQQSPAIKNATVKRRGGKDIIDGDEKPWMQVVELSNVEREQLGKIKKTDQQSVGDKRSHDEVLISDLKKFFSQSQEQKKTIADEIKEITLIETRKDLSKSQLFNILIPSMYDEATWDVVSKDLTKKEKLFKTFVRSSQDHVTFLRAWEKFLNQRNTNLLNKAPILFKIFYDKDYVDEDAVLEWYNQAKDSSEVKKKCTVFVNWLKNAEEEE
ncbi:9050_t:CDS:2, partial [Acaulospora morrowiae]